MPFLKPTPTPFDPAEWRTRPFAERAHQACLAWIDQGYGVPVGVYLAYLLKIGFFVAVWFWSCAQSPTLGGPATVTAWWLEPLAFQKAILWSLLFEVLGIGCGSGPLAGRYLPPFGGFTYFLRPGTVTFPLRPGMPVLGGSDRSWLDVALYAFIVGALGSTLAAPSVDAGWMLCILVAFGIAGTSDRTLLLAARGEHYLVMLAVFCFAGDWIAGAKAIWLALWFWAGVSKLNHHFASVVGVMTCNGPLTPSVPYRRSMVRQHPSDVAPSTRAQWLGHFGTALELGVPLVLCFATGPTGLTIGLVLMVLLHGYISSNVPMGVPLEWNVTVVYGAFFLWLGHPEIGLDQLDAPLLGGLLGVVLIGVPLLGNLRPDLVPFLPAMRYYAGNWAMSVWLLKRGAEQKLKDHLRMTSPWVIDQLSPFYSEDVIEGMVGRVMAFRLMHLHGRALGPLVQRAAPDLNDRYWIDGELMAGMVRGWNFGDGHLHDERLLADVQARCGFAPGELVCVMVESQPMFQKTQHWRILDAARGLLDEGHVPVEALRSRQPWDTHPWPGLATEPRNEG
ncbi:MAG: hypothetical protein CL927_10420 [Deltaproteobacteria bacterium]|nr:hypothetical protein [Deltaproteobacteria bacterium]